MSKKTPIIIIRVHQSIILITYKSFELVRFLDGKVSMFCYVTEWEEKKRD